MLTTFTPASGPKAGVAYTLPVLTEAHKPRHYFAVTPTQIARAVGAMLPSGTGVGFPTAATLPCTFRLTPNLLHFAGYSNASDLVNLETALYDFAMYVFEGGLGTLVDSLPTGTKRGLGGATLTSRSASAIILNNPEVDRENGGTAASIIVEFVIPGAQWLNSDGSLDLIT